MVTARADRGVEGGLVLAAIVVLVILSGARAATF